MNCNSIETISKKVADMDEYLRKLYYENKLCKKLWENTHIYHQIEKRKRQEQFNVEDHIRAVVYSMLSAGIQWNRVEKYIEGCSGEMPLVDKVFYNYCPEYIEKCNPNELLDKIKEMGLASISTRKQMEALIGNGCETGIVKIMVEWGKKHKSIDDFYKDIGRDNHCTLIKQLSSNGENKLRQLGPALTAEYLRNVGYDLAKPDRHIRRILGSDYLGCSESKETQFDEAMEIIYKIAEKLEKSVAEVDYIIWSYCADGFGEICVKPSRYSRKEPKCVKCVARDICNINDDFGLNQLQH